MNLDSLRAVHDLAAKTGCRAVFGEPLCGHTTWGIGGKAELFLEPDSPDQLSGLLRLISASGLPFVVIGHGSNLLICDESVRGVVIKIGPRLSGIRCHGSTIEADAGTWVPRLARSSMKAGLTGLEHAIGIPGTVGGLVVMNGGSQRECIGSRIREVRALTLDGREALLCPEECGFAYRKSVFQKGSFVIASVRLELEFGERGEVRREMLRILRDRRRKFPLKQPSCGSVFRGALQRDGKVVPPGKLIEEAGTKGVRVGGAQVSPLHANFIVNCGNATASDVIELVRLVHGKVMQTSAVSLDCEVRHLDPRCCFTTIVG